MPKLPGEVRFVIALFLANPSQQKCQPPAGGIPGKFTGLDSKILSYGLNPEADIYSTQYELLEDSINAEILVFGKSIEISTTLVGKYNLYNILASIAWLI